jgi:hypothetical protein
MNSKKYKTTYPGSLHSKIIQIMQKKSKPMTVEQITELLIRNSYLNGKTPNKTVSSTLQRSYKIKSISRGLYKLKST